jgi:YHS domain-containing protein
MCEAKFRESPDTYAHSTDPVSGKRVDKASAPIYAYRGKAFFFENQGSLEQFAKAPERYVSQSR